MSDNDTPVVRSVLITEPMLKTYRERVAWMSDAEQAQEEWDQLEFGRVAACKLGVVREEMEKRRARAQEESDGE